MNPLLLCIEYTFTNTRKQPWEEESEESIP